MKQQRVLCIAYFFPPAGGAGVQRPVKFIKYLGAVGWDADVVSVAHGDFWVEDPTLLPELPETTVVHRAWSIEPWRWLGGSLRVWGRALARRLLVPDTQAGWIPGALWKAWRAVKGRAAGGDPHALLWSTSAPYSAHLVGWLLKRWMGLPWVADFRDSWTDNPLIPARRPWHRWLERRVVAKADKVVSVTDGMTASFRRRYPDQAVEKFVTIPNGYDPADFASGDSASEEASAARPLTITFTGTFYATISPVTFLQALHRVLTRRGAVGPAAAATAGDAAGQLVQVRFVGQCDRRQRKLLDRWVRALQLDDVVRWLGYVPHRESVKLLKASDLLLLVLFSGRGASQHISGKIYEYLAAHRPVLALADSGPAADLIRRAQVGEVVHPNDVAGVAQALEHFFNEHENRAGGIAYRGEPHVISSFDQRRLTTRLGDVFDSCVGITKEERHP